MGCGPCVGSCGAEQAPAGVRTGAVVADERDAPSVARAPAPPGGFGGADLRGLDHVKLASLWALLARRDLGLGAIEEFAPLHEESGDGPWVYRFPAELAGLLAAVDAEGARAIAGPWAGTDELLADGWDEAGAAAVLGDLCALARTARAGGKPLLLWMSL